MTSEEKVHYWLDIAAYDIETAEAMYQTGRWLYVAFMCHQVIEKTIKAYWCATQPEDPSYTHSHDRHSLYYRSCYCFPLILLHVYLPLFSDLYTD